MGGNEVRGERFGDLGWTWAGDVSRLAIAWRGGVVRMGCGQELGASVVIWQFEMHLGWRRLAFGNNVAWGVIQMWAADRNQMRGGGFGGLGHTWASDVTRLAIT